jgi:hypothetical protein
MRNLTTSEERIKRRVTDYYCGTQKTDARRIMIAHTRELCAHAGCVAARVSTKISCQFKMRVNQEGSYATSSWRVRRYLIRSRNSAARSNSYFAAADRI